MTFQSVRKQKEFEVKEYGVKKNDSVAKPTRKVNEKDHADVLSEESGKYSLVERHWKNVILSSLYFDMGGMRN